MAKKRNVSPRVHPRPTLDRDLAMARERLPVSLGGEGLSTAQIAEKHGMSTDAVYKALQNEDVREAHSNWLKAMSRKQRELGPEAHEAVKELISKREPGTVRAYMRGMQVWQDSPSAVVDIEKLELTVPPEFAELLKVNPAYREQAEEPDEEDGAAPGAYPCPAPSCGTVFEEMTDLAQHILSEHAEQVPVDASN